MTNPLPSLSGVAPIPSSHATPQAPIAQAPDPFTVEVTRAAAAPVYVYRMTDTATGRVLVEIPNEPTAATPGAPGSKVDAKA